MDAKKAVFFCSSSYNIDPKYNQAARDVVRAACACGYDIVSGGTVKGTMLHVADEAIRCGRASIGILPRFMQGLEYPRLTELVWTDTMAERKELMRAGTSLAVALPGGIGTLDELFETFTLAKLRRYPGRVVAYNFEGFYDSLVRLLDEYVAAEMLDPASRALIAFPETVAEFVKVISQE